jgi:hypothetical protein
MLGTGVTSDGGCCGAGNEPLEASFDRNGHRNKLQSKQLITDPSDRRIQLHRRHVVRHSEAHRQMVARLHSGHAHDFRPSQRNIQDDAQAVAVNGGPALQTHERKRTGKRGRHPMPRISPQIHSDIVSSFDLRHQTTSWIVMQLRQISSACHERRKTAAETPGRKTGPLSNGWWPRRYRPRGSVSGAGDSP